MVFTFVLGMVLNGTTVLLPLFLQSMLGYDATTAGMALAGGGFIMLVMMPIAGTLVSRMDPRIMMGVGFAITSSALYYMATHLNLGIDFRTAALMRVMQTSGLAFIFLPSNTLAYVGIPREQNNQVSGMNAFVRNIGGSIGIALLTTMLTRFSQQNQSALVAHAYAGQSGIRQSVRRHRAVAPWRRARCDQRHATGLRARHGSGPGTSGDDGLRAGDHEDGAGGRVPHSAAADHAAAANRETGGRRRDALA